MAQSQVLVTRRQLAARIHQAGEALQVLEPQPAYDHGPELIGSIVLRAELQLYRAMLRTMDAAEPERAR